jgi:hypothetical protein
VAHHLLGDAPDQQMREAGPALGRHDDEVRALRRRDDAGGGISELDVEARGGRAAPAQLAPHELVEAPLRARDDLGIGDPSGDLRELRHRLIRRDDVQHRQASPVLARERDRHPERVRRGVREVVGHEDAAEDVHRRSIARLRAGCIRPKPGIRTGRAAASDLGHRDAHRAEFPTLEQAEVDRLGRFGETRSYATGDRLVSTGEVSPGMFVILAGEVAVTQHNALGRDQPIVTHHAGSFMGELAQLSGRPALVDARAVTPVDALIISTPRLRDVLVGGGGSGRAHHARAHPPSRRPLREPASPARRSSADAWDGNVPPARRLPQA